NLVFAAEKLDVFIRINLTQDDEAEFDQLYSGIIERDLHKSLKAVNIAHVFVPECSRTDVDLESLHYQTYVEIERRERAKAKALGVPMKAFFPFTRVEGCTATCKSSTSIGPDGLLYKCVEDVGLADRAYGTVFDGSDVKLDNLFPWLKYDWFKYEMCKECLILPTCAGGCAHKRLFQSDELQNENFCYWHLRGDLENKLREYALDNIH
ncbi:unnamed protein product, partial [marine sediment metagenome]